MKVKRFFNWVSKKWDNKRADFFGEIYLKLEIENRIYEGYKFIFSYDNKENGGNLVSFFSDELHDLDGLFYFYDVFKKINKLTKKEFLEKDIVNILKKCNFVDETQYTCPKNEIKRQLKQYNNELEYHKEKIKIINTKIKNIKISK